MAIKKVHTENDMAHSQGLAEFLGALNDQQQHLQLEHQQQQQLLLQQLQQQEQQEQRLLVQTQLQQMKEQRDALAIELETIRVENEAIWNDGNKRVVAAATAQESDAIRKGYDDIITQNNIQKGHAMMERDHAVLQTEIARLELQQAAQD